MFTNNFVESRVEWIHRTARDFLQDKPVWNKVLNATGRDDFDPRNYWANAHLAALKRLDLSDKTRWYQFGNCVHPAFYLHWGEDVRLVEYLDEVGRTAELTCEYYRTSQFLSDCGVSPNKDQAMKSFLDFAMWFQLDLYVKIKAPLAPPSELQHAIRYRNGLGGNVVRGSLKSLPKLHSDWLYDNMVDKTAFLRTERALKYALRRHRRRRVWNRITMGLFT